MARPRKPTALLELNGSFKTHADRKAARAYEPKPTEPLGNAPSYMTKEQKKLWKELAGMVVEGVLTRSDRIAVETAVQLVGKLRAGTIKPQETSILTTLLGKLGMTPSDRSKVSVAPQKKEQEESWDEFTTPPQDDEDAPTVLAVKPKLQ